MTTETPERAALRELVAKLRQIEGHPEFKGMWGYLDSHGFKYKGPNWADALDAASAVLAAPSAPLALQPVYQRLYAEADHMLENSRRLAKYEGAEQEARARELASTYRLRFRRTGPCTTGGPSFAQPAAWNTSRCTI